MVTQAAGVSTIAKQYGTELHQRCTSKGASSVSREERSMEDTSIKAVPQSLNAKTSGVLQGVIDGLLGRVIGLVKVVVHDTTIVHELHPMD